MNSTGMVRKIDELGRIVIPKEIRNSLNIKESDSLEILVSGEYITLKKYYKMNNTKDVFKKYIDIVEHLVDSNYLITDKEKVILSSEKYNYLIGTKITNNLYDLIIDRKQKINKNEEELKILENVIIKAAYIITPIIIGSDSIGSVVCFTEGQLKDTDILSTNILSYLIKNQY